MTDRPMTNAEKGAAIEAAILSVSPETVVLRIKCGFCGGCIPIARGDLEAAAGGGFQLKEGRTEQTCEFCDGEQDFEIIKWRIGE